MIITFVLVTPRFDSLRLKLVLDDWATGLKARRRKGPTPNERVTPDPGRKPVRGFQSRIFADRHQCGRLDRNIGQFDDQFPSMNTATISPLLAVATKKQRKIILAGFSVTRAVFRRITEMFQHFWLSKTGEKVIFGLSFAGSGVQSRAIRDGLPAHVCCLALADDIEKLVRIGYIKPSWRDRAPKRGIVARSITVIASRVHKGPSSPSEKRCKRFMDILTENLAVITANPKSAGAARWNFLGLWSAARSGSVPFDEDFIRNALEAKAKPENAPLCEKLEADCDWIAFAFLKEVYLRAPLLPRDGRDATDVFVRQELGDVLITYENEAILSQMRGLPLDYCVPQTESNCLIEFPISVIDQNAAQDNVADIAHAFVEYCFGEEAQRTITEYGFRPVSEPIFQHVKERFPTPPLMETVDDDYGGWGAVMRKFFAPGAIFDILFDQVARELLQRRRKQSRWGLWGSHIKISHEDSQLKPARTSLCRPA
ncbi:hypothetical protein F1559_002414 [Cyanidiococcus yangmingshanensis]|uniref:Uncharacterized protein n=1 Tax=Cyanidiococcus yangmingshanensis TaxID=2690220 RepID=A0A7J7IQ17_9RHOD|nr:hypothetical protein F1559_002414 [Cyanidiococcus yangmingshanensis]